MAWNSFATGFMDYMAYHLVYFYGQVMACMEYGFGMGDLKIW